VETMITMIGESIFQEHPFRGLEAEP
jgi:hypothetical protein